MNPSLGHGDILIVSRNDYKDRFPKRGDIVIFEIERSARDRNVKRIVGLPNEEVELSEGMLFINGEHHAEPYLGGLPASVGIESQSWRLKEDEYFVMGDNRAHSTDSRKSGPISRNQIIGRVRFRVWPLTRWGKIN